MMKISNSDKEHISDRHIEIRKGFLFGMKITHRDDTKVKMEERQRKLIKVQQELGHPSKHVIQETGLKMGLKMKGSMQHCKGCKMGKTRQKGMKRETVSRAKKIDERTFMEINSIKHVKDTRLNKKL